MSQNTSQLSQNLNNKRRRNFTSEQPITYPEEQDQDIYTSSHMDIIKKNLNLNSSDKKIDNKVIEKIEKQNDETNAELLDQKFINSNLENDQNDLANSNYLIPSNLKQGNFEEDNQKNIFLNSNSNMNMNYNSNSNMNKNSNMDTNSNIISDKIITNNSINMKKKKVIINQHEKKKKKLKNKKKDIFDNTYYVLYL